MQNVQTIASWLILRKKKVRDVIAPMTELPLVTLFTKTKKLTQAFWGEYS